MTIGGTLAKARQDAGLTVIQVSGATRIREAVVRAIERDDYTACGGNFYARGHIRAIARSVGIDPEPLIAVYDEEHGGAPQAMPATEAFAPETPIKYRERRPPNWSAAMAVVFVLVLGYVVVHAVTSGGGRAQQAGNQASHPSPTLQRVRGGDDVTVQVKAKSASRLNVRDSDGGQLFSGVVNAGSVQEWTAKKRISLVIGNGGGVTLVVNGKDVGSPGSGGQVVRVGFGPTDPGSG